MEGSTYVHYGCGFSVGKGWINFDASPTLRLERLPVMGPFLARHSGNGRRFPSSVRYGDIVSGLPIPKGSARGVFASHILEHLSYDDCLVALQNTHDMLQPGGIFRLVVPDLETRARRYLEAVEGGQTGANSEFLRLCHLGQQRRPRSFMGRLRMIYGHSNHLWMWDEPSMRARLMEAGFAEVRRCQFGDCSDPMFSRVEEEGRFFEISIGHDELAMEARKRG